MRVSQQSWDGADAASLSAELRSRVPAPEAIAGDVAALIERVRVGGDQAVLDLGAELDGGRPESLHIAPERLSEALERIDGGLREALTRAAANIEAVATAQVNPDAIEVEPGQGQRVTIAEVAVGAAGIYVPGGRAPYPSTVLMSVIAARAAGVGRIAVASPPGESGAPADAILAACSIAGADEVYAMGGAQAIAALALGTETVASVDVIAGPGGPWVQEAKLAVSRHVGIDSYAGPSELVVVADASAPLDWLALDLCAQAEHGVDGLLTAIVVGEGLGEALEAAVADQAGAPSVSDAPLEIVGAPDTASAVELADALAPEHLQICCEDATALAGTVRRAGCVFVGPFGATAFGDYAAGSNHVLPTGGAGRFRGPLGPGTFRRRISIVEMDQASSVELGPVVAEIANAEGFEVHGASALARAQSPDGEGR
jgi:histidinol dehydrogenase